MTSIYTHTRWLDTRPLKKSSHFCSIFAINNVLCVLKLHCTWNFTWCLLKSNLFLLNLSLTFYPCLFDSQKEFHWLWITLASVWIHSFHLTKFTIWMKCTLEIRFTHNHCVYFEWLRERECVSCGHASNRFEMLDMPMCACVFILCNVHWWDKILCNYLFQEWPPVCESMSKFSVIDMLASLSHFWDCTSFLSFGFWLFDLFIWFGVHFL